MLNFWLTHGEWRPPRPSNNANQRNNRIMICARSEYRQLTDVWALPGLLHKLFG
jgi:hypothetical protein